MRLKGITTMMYIALALLVPSTPLSAPPDSRGTIALAQQTKPSEIESVRQGTLILIGWFRSLLSAMDSIVAAEEKDKLIPRLEALRKSLYRVEQDKRDFLYLLQRQPPDEREIAKSLKNLQEEVTGLRQTVRKVGDNVRSRYRQGGIDAEDRLSKAVYSKVWILEFQEELRKGKTPDVKPYIMQVRATIDALRSAQIELTKLIDALGKKTT